MTFPSFDYDKLDVDDILRVTFFPRPVEDTVAPPAKSMDFPIPVADGITLGSRFYYTEDLTSANILFFHGNGEIVSDYDEIGPMYNEQNMNLLVVDYRGYGKSDGTPTVTTMMSDAVEVLNEFKKLLNEQNRTGRFIVMGRSLGSSSALEIAARCPDQIDALIIESGFAETLSLLASFGVDIHALGLTEADCFHNLEKIRLVKKPTLILHAQNDQVIPIAQGTMLQMECGSVDREIQIVPGAGHNNIIEVTGKMYFEVIKRFINKIGRKKRPKKVGVR